MIGEFITRCLVLVLGYAYPAFQCFKTVEKNRVEIQELRFWCQYWIIVAALTILEKIGDVFVSWYVIYAAMRKIELSNAVIISKFTFVQLFCLCHWLPMYGEMKLALFIYLWYPKTKGTGYVYETLLRPYVSKHETDIDRSLVEFRNRAWDLAAYYWQNCTELGSIKILQLLQFVTSQSTRITQPTTSQNVDNRRPGGAPPPTPPTTPSAILQNNKPEKKRPIVPTWRTSTSNRAQTPKFESIQVQLQDQTNYIRPEDVIVPDLDIGEGSQEKCSVELNLHAARLKLRRSKGGTN